MTKIVTSVALLSIRSLYASNSFLQFFSPSGRYDDGYAVSTRGSRTFVASWSWDPVVPYQCQRVSRWIGSEYDNSSLVCLDNGVEFPNGIEVLSNGDPVVGGRVSMDQNAIQSAIIYRRGSSPWTKIFSEYRQTQDGARAIAEVFGLSVDSSDSIYSVGHVYFYSFNESATVSPFVTKQGSNGSLIGARILEGSGMCGFKAITTSGGNLTMAGVFYDGDYYQGYGSILLTRFSRNLTLDWVKVFSWFDNHASDVVVGQDGSIYITASSTTPSYSGIIKCDGTGTILWAIRAETSTDLTSLAFTKTGDLIFGGASRTSGSEGGHIGSLTPTSQLKWALIVNPGQRAMIRSLASDNLGAFYAAGYSYNQSISTLMFGKIDEQGEVLNCSQVQNITLIFTNITSSWNTSIPDLTSVNWTTINFTDWTGFTTHTSNARPEEACFEGTASSSSNPLSSSSEITDSAVSSTSKEAVDLVVVIALVAAACFAIIVASGGIGVVYYIRRIKKLQADLDARGGQQVDLNATSIAPSPAQTDSASKPIAHQYQNVDTAAVPMNEIPHQYENVPPTGTAEHQYQNVKEGVRDTTPPHQYENVSVRRDDAHQYQNMPENE